MRLIVFKDYKIFSELLQYFYYVLLSKFLLIPLNLERDKNVSVLFS
jgi:hypothetical protein